MNEERKKIAIQGIPGAFHEIAARRYYADPIDIVPAISFPDLIDESLRHDGGMMAIENSIAGSLLRNFPLIQNSPLQITGEVYLRIKHNLMAVPGQQLNSIKEVHSHPMAIAQCREFFKALPHIRLVETEDTALSAKRLAESKEKGIAAIASAMAADLYELEILNEGIETNKQNYTRFLSLEKNVDTDNLINFEKASVCFALDHAVGSLYQVLKILADQGANLTKIQSVPIVGDRWKYNFFVDFVLEDPSKFQKTIEIMHLATTNLEVLGRYKKGTHYEN